MNQALETKQDFWNPETAIHVRKLQVLPPQIKNMDGEGSKRAVAGQLFTMVAAMTTREGDAIEVSVTGYFRATLDIHNPRGWLPSDCFAPRKHNNGVPPVRLLSYPRTLCTADGSRMTTLELSQLIADQLNDDQGWRTNICSKVEAITARDIAAKLGLDVPAEEKEEPKESLVDDQELDDDDTFNLDEPATDAGSEGAEGASEDLEADDANDFNLDDDETDSDLGDSAEQPRASESDNQVDDDLSFDDLGDDNDNDDADEWSGLSDDADSELADLDEALAELDGEENFQHAVSGEAAKPEPSGEEKKGHFSQLQAVMKGGRRTEAEPELPQLAEAAETPATKAPEPTPIRKAQDEPVKPQVRVTKPTGPMDADSKPEPSSNVREAPMQECELFHEQGFDVAFFGREHGEAELIDGSGGALGTLYTTRAGRIVLHIDGHIVEDFDPSDVEPVFERMGYTHNAKRLYKSANIKCVRYLE